MVLRPTGKLDLDLYVDADFCGLHGREDNRNPNSARSRTGYIIFLSNCALLWKSTLQTHISLSTLEAKRLLLELTNALNIEEEVFTSVRARVFEDNQGALYLATNHRITNRTKYFIVKWHWFWQHASEFEIYKVESEHQRADYFTKSLPRDAFEHNRLSVQGW